MIKYILKLTYGFKGRIALSSVAGTARVATGLIFVALSKRAVDIATGDVSGSLSACIAGLVGVLAAELLCAAIGNRTMDLSEAEMKNKLQEKLFGKLMNSTWSGKEKFHSGEILSRLTEDSRVASECLCRTIPSVVIAFVQFLGAFAFLWYFSPVLATAVVVLLPLFMMAGKAFFRKMRILTRRVRDIESRLQEKMQESLQHRILLLTCGQGRRTMEAIVDMHHSRYSFIRRRADITMYSRSAVFAGFQSGYLAAFIWGVAGIYRKTISFGTMTAYLQLAGQIQRPLGDLARLLPGMIQSQTAFSRLSEIEGITPEEETSDLTSIFKNSGIGISLRDVTFGYPDSEKKIFDEFSHIFMPGSRTAIMGETGAGKSTLLRLILALLKPESGDITLFTESDGLYRCIPVSNATRRLMVYVPQGNSLMSGTIRFNLRLGKEDATEKEMKEALHAAAADFVFDLKFGLETTCGEHGGGLSEGQAQRIAIARGLLSPGKILLLDEISASLDEETESLLMKRLAERSESKTILFVTHRKGVLPYCHASLQV